jgi:hypothetical protein
MGEHEKDKEKRGGPEGDGQLPPGQPPPPPPKPGKHGKK